MATNTLGAPAEGLGQNVTFSFNPANGVPQLNIPSAGPSRTGLQGFQPTPLQLNRPNLVAPSSGVVDLLAKAGSAAITKSIERAKTEKFVAGMQRAMTGEAVGDIVKDQPWYSQLFGDSAVVEGARAYSQQANVTEAVTKMEEDMPKLRELTSAEAQKHFSATINEALTGDPATDAAVFQAYARTLPGLMRRQVKEHYGWKQEQVVLQHDRAIGAMAKRLQAAGPAYLQQYVNDEEFAGMRQELLQLTRPADGENEKSWQGRITGQLRRMGEAGQLHALNAFVDAGILDVLDAQGLAQVTAVRNKAEREAQSQSRERWSDKIIEVYAQAQNPKSQHTTEELLQVIDGMNAEHKKLTGSSEGVFTEDERRALATRSISEIIAAKQAQYRKAETAAAKASTDQEKIAAAEMRRVALIDSVRQGTTHHLGTTEAEREKELTPWLQGLSPEQRTTALVSLHANSNIVLKSHATDLQANVRRMLQAGEVDQTLLLPVYQQWKAMNAADPATAKAYYGEHGDNFARFHRSMEQTGGTIPIAMQAFMERPPKGEVDQKMVDSVAAAMKPSTLEWIGSLWDSSIPLRDGQTRLLAQTFARDIEEATGTYGADLGTKTTLTNAKRAGRFELVGGYVVTKDPKLKPLALYLTEPSNYTGKAAGVMPFGKDTSPDKAFAEALDYVLYGDPRTDKAGVIPQNNFFGRVADFVRVIRIDDRKSDGVPQFWIHAVSGDDQFTAPLSADSLFAIHESQKKRPLADIEPARRAPLDIEPGYVSPIEQARQERLRRERQSK